MSVKKGKITLVSKKKEKQNKAMEKELENRKDLEEWDGAYSYLYPNLDDANFNIKIA